MKVEKINVQLEAQKIHGQFGTTETANYKIQKLCEAYAKLQIEKDREDLIKENKLTNNGMIAYNIRSRPIILD